MDGLHSEEVGLYFIRYEHVLECGRDAPSDLWSQQATASWAALKYFKVFSVKKGYTMTNYVFGISSQLLELFHRFFEVWIIRTLLFTEEDDTFEDERL